MGTSINEAVFMARAALARGEVITCDTCGKPATCVGTYEDMETPEPACDACCGHGCEDGHCVQIVAD